MISNFVDTKHGVQKTLQELIYKLLYNIIAKQSDSTHCKKMYLLYAVLYGIDRAAHVQVNFDEFRGFSNFHI